MECTNFLAVLYVLESTEINSWNPNILEPAQQVRMNGSEFLEKIVWLKK